jgi:hypothetical protein
MLLNITKTLSGNGFELTTTKDQLILSNAVSKSFRIEFGADLGGQISELISEIVGDSWNKIISDYSLLEDSLRKIFQKGTENILSTIRNEILNSVNTSDYSKKSIPEILSDLRKQEVFKTLKNLDKNQHPILLFSKTEFRSKIIQEFFNTKIPDDSKGCFSENPNKFGKRTITYDRILDGEEISVGKVNQFLNEVHQKNSTALPSRFACENTVWFKNKGLFEEHQEMGRDLDPRVISQSCILCCYDLNQLQNDQINRIIQSRGIIILENPISIYKRKIS